MFPKFKAKRRHKKLQKHGIVVSPEFENDSNILFYGERTGIWPIYKSLPSSNAVVYAFGIGNNIDWELGVVKELDAQVYAFDPTPNSVKWMETQNLPNKLHFEPIGLADYCGELDFFIPRRAGRFNYSVVKRGGKYPNQTISCQVRDLASLCESNQHSHVDVVKLDIEGSEMTALPSILNSGIEVDQFLIEFHYNYQGIEFDDTVKIINTLFEKGYKLFWLSDRAYEFAFIKC